MSLADGVRAGNAFPLGNGRAGIGLATSADGAVVFWPVTPGVEGLAGATVPLTAGLLSGFGKTGVLTTGAGGVGVLLPAGAEPPAAGAPTTGVAAFVPGITGADGAAFGLAAFGDGRAGSPAGGGTGVPCVGFVC